MSNRSEQVPMDFRSAWQKLHEGRLEKFCAGPSCDGSVKIVFPGAFNPLHEGHLKMAALAGERLGGSVNFELSIENVDKPLLDERQVAGRLQQFSRQQPVWITRAPTFARKAMLFPGATFVVGVDTLQRIVQPQYYDGEAQGADRAIEKIIDCGCRFLIFGRLLKGRFAVREDLPLPQALSDLCTSVCSSDFRVDIASTDLRARGQE